MGHLGQIYSLTSKDQIGHSCTLKNAEFSWEYFPKFLYHNEIRLLNAIDSLIGPNQAVENFGAGWWTITFPGFSGALLLPRGTCILKTSHSFRFQFLINYPSALISELPWGVDGNWHVDGNRYQHYPFSKVMQHSVILYSMVWCGEKHMHPHSNSRYSLILKSWNY